MKRAQKVAVTSSILGFVLALLNPGILLDVLIMVEHEKPGEILRTLLGLLLLYIGPAFLMAFGAYRHSSTAKKSYFVLVVVGSIILIAELPILFVALPYYFFASDWLNRIFLTFLIVPGCLAIITLVASVIARERASPK